MTRKRAKLAAAGDIEQLRRAVMRAGRKHAAVRGEGHRADPASEAAKGSHLAAAGRLPEFDRPIAAGGGQQLAVARERDCRHPGRVSDQGAQFASARHVPEFDGIVGVDAVGGERAAARGEHASVRRECHRIDPGRGPRERAKLAAGCRVPKPNRPVAAAGRRHAPSGEKATDMTWSPCPARVRSSRPLVTSHSLTVRSTLPEARMRPSGEKAIELMMAA